MKLKSLHLRNFRNYANCTFFFSPHRNIICGDNAQGKSNLLEAIYLLSTGRSFRTPHLHELIKDKESYFFLEGEMEKDNCNHHIKIFYDGKEKKVSENEKTYTHFSPLLGLLPSVLFVPSDVDLISGPPHIRRKFFNFHLAQHDPKYLYHLSRYWKALKQRNALLKAQEETTIESFEEELAKSAVYLASKRKKMLEDILPLVSEYLTKLTPSVETISLDYPLPYPLEASAYLSFLKKHRKKDMFLGATQHGPHRDDFFLHLDGKLAADYASEGQKKTVIASLKLAEWKLFCHLFQNKVLLNIDDFGVHLDPFRKNLLQELLQNVGQVFITTPTPIEGEKTFTISKGTLLPENSVPENSVPEISVPENSYKN
ncbi:MAG: DNA replication/repair protein RecF [Chlamydiota bacterium]